MMINLICYLNLDDTGLHKNKNISHIFQKKFEKQTCASPFPISRWTLNLLCKNLLARPSHINLKNIKEYLPMDYSTFSF